MKMILIGATFPWHHTMIAKRFFEYLGFEITHINPEDLPLQFEPYEIDVLEDIDYVVVFQGSNSFKINRSKNTRVIQFCGEVYWKPSCVNPDFLITAFPEMMDRYMFQYPTYFPQLKGYLESRMFIDPKAFDSMQPKKPGVFFTGARYAGIGLYNFRAYRRGYDDRDEFLDEVGSMVHILEPNYDEGVYNRELGTHEAELVIQGLDAYMSKRPLENAAAGAINLLYIKDSKQIEYYMKLGWIHMKNCYYVLKRIDICDFLGTIRHDVKQEIRVQAYQHVVQNYTLHSIWNEWVQWFKECENKK